MLLWQEHDTKMKITDVQKKFTVLKAGLDSLLMFFLLASVGARLKPAVFFSPVWL